MFQIALKKGKELEELEERAVKKDLQENPFPPPGTQTLQSSLFSLTLIIDRVSRIEQKSVPTKV